MSKPKTSHGAVALNRRARFDYEIEEEFEAGLQLMGSEVKSLREGRANIAESYISPERDEISEISCARCALISLDYCKFRKDANCHSETNFISGASRSSFSYAREPSSLFCLEKDANRKISAAIVMCVFLDNNFLQLK